MARAANPLIRVLLAIVVATALVGVGGGLASSAALRSQGTEGGEWLSCAGDNRNHHYAPLAQIDAGNFKTLEVAWRFKTDNLGTRPEFKLEGTPLMARRR